MVNIREFVKTWKGKKELSDLPALDLQNLEIKSDTFDIGGVKKPFSYIEIDGWKYTLNASIIQQLKDILEKNPLCAKIQFKKTTNGIVVIDL